MHRQTKPSSVVNQAPSYCCYAAVSCPAQVLVIDRLNGPANVLADTISLLLEREVSVTTVEDHDDALLHLLIGGDYDLVMVGLEPDRPMQLAILPYICVQNPDARVMVVGRDIPRLYRQYARYHGACEVLNMPQRAADLKALVKRMAQRYLRTSATV
ncbi:MAG: hypothetical protein JXJ20_03730 [Anaerolineae bacterium]|jgi:DNA-binding NtrC family response regulator|nr:hypothetical protein [Anaerolineae bacterium]